MAQTIQTLQRAYQRLEDQHHTLAATSEADIDVIAQLEFLNDSLRTPYVFVLESANQQASLSEPHA